MCVTFSFECQTSNIIHVISLVLRMGALSNMFYQILWMENFTLPKHHSGTPNRNWRYPNLGIFWHPNLRINPTNGTQILGASFFIFVAVVCWLLQNPCKNTILRQLQLNIYQVKTEQGGYFCNYFKLHLCVKILNFIQLTS